MRSNCISCVKAVASSGAQPNALCLHSHSAPITALSKNGAGRNRRSRLYSKSVRASNGNKKSQRGHVVQNESRFPSNQFHPMQEIGLRLRELGIRESMQENRKRNQEIFKALTMSKLRPHNNWLQQTALGRHTFCVRKSCAGALRPVMTGLRPRSLLSQALYGVQDIGN